MTEQEFDKAFHGIKAPAYRGASYPKFDPAAINMSRVPDELRVKEFEYTFNEGEDSIDDELHVKWKSQEWDEYGVDEVIDEMTRCLSDIGFIGTVYLHIFERGYEGSGEHEEFHTFAV